MRFNRASKVASAQFGKCVAVITLLPSLQLVLAATGSCHLRELEVCVVGVASLLQNPNGLPANEEEIKRHCEFLEESSKCFEEFAERCLTSNQYHLAEFFSGGLFELKMEFCKQGSEFRSVYLKNADCLREVQRKHQTQCATDLQVGFESIHKMNHSMRLATTCCNLGRLRECVLPRVDELCGPDALELANKLLTRVVGKRASNICRSYDTSQSDGNCASILPKAGSKPHYGRNTSVISRIVSSYALKQTETGL